jgi:uncharacterized membrane protein
MAGIGFRLQRVAAADTLTATARAHLYATLASSGPWLLSICTLAALALVSALVIPRADDDLFSAIVAYTSTAVLVTTAGPSMLIARHLADALYVGDTITPLSLYRGALAVTACGHLVLAALFYLLAPDLSLPVRLVAISLAVVVSCTWTAMAFAGAARDYSVTVRAFVVGNSASLGLALLLGAWWRLPGYLAGFGLGQTFILVSLTAWLEREFASPARAGQTPRRRRGRYRILLLAGFCYGAALAVDRVVLWISPAGTGVGSWFYRSVWDTPVFLAYLSVLPLLGSLVLTLETRFYAAYRRYYGACIEHGRLNQILVERNRLEAIILDALRGGLWIQVPITLALMLLASEIGAWLALEPLQVALLRVALVGAALQALSFYGIVLLLYFDRQRAVLEVTAANFLVNTLVTTVAVVAGPRFYGLGLAAGALVACLIATRRMEQTLDQLEYLTFASQPLAPDR